MLKLRKGKEIRLTTTDPLLILIKDKIKQDELVEKLSETIVVDIFDYLDFRLTTSNNDIIFLKNYSPKDMNIKIARLLQEVKQANKKLVLFSTSIGDNSLLDFKRVLICKNEKPEEAVFINYGEVTREVI